MREHDIEIEYEAPDIEEPMVLEVTYTVSWGSPAVMPDFKNECGYPGEFPCVEDIISVRQVIIDPWGTKHIHHVEPTGIYEHLDKIEDYLIDHAAGEL